jgi:hypothetical protein
MKLKAYLRKGRVFIPTLGLVTRGLYRDIEPVTIVDVSEAETLRRTFRETAARGHRQLGHIHSQIPCRWLPNMPV